MKMDDDDFGGFEAAETFDCGDSASHLPVSQPIPWAAFSSVSGLSSPPDILLDQHPSFQAEPLEPSTPHSPPEPEQTLRSQNALPEVQSVEVIKAPEFPGGQEAYDQLQQTLSSLKSKLSASDEEKSRMQQDLEELMEKLARTEEQFQTEQRVDAERHRSHLSELQEQHDRALEDLRKAGHKSLAVIVEEFKAHTKSAVLQQEEIGQKCLEVAMERQREKCEELLNAQHQRLLDLLDTERDSLEEKLKESLSQQADLQKDLLVKCVQEEKEKAQEAVEAVVKAQEERMKEAVLEAVQEERRCAEKRLTEERAEWEAERRRDREALAQAIQDALVEQRRVSKEAVKEAITQQRQAGEKHLEEATTRLQDEFMGYMKEQKRLDHLTRQRSLASLELFLSCAQQQLAGLMKDGGSEIQAESTGDTSDPTHT